jgi:hypothetical protein
MEKEVKPPVTLETLSERMDDWEKSMEEKSIRQAATDKIIPAPLTRLQTPQKAITFDDVNRELAQLHARLLTIEGRFVPIAYLPRPLDDVPVEKRTA